jgi:DNA-binding transcriptional ArsR family regulator/uncharacterized protein YndB with AHSA1/START domain
MIDAFETVWRALADPVRREILDLLRSGPRTTGDLCSRFPLSRFGVMKHIAVLEEARLVVFERRGRERWNHLNAVRLREALSRWVDGHHSGWAERLMGLGQLLKGIDPVSDFPTPRMFNIRQEVEYRASCTRVFAALTDGIDQWWQAPYRQVEDSRLMMRPEVGSPMLESGRDGHTALWAVVDEVKPGALLALSGRFAVRGAVAGHVRYELEATPGGCRLVLQHRAVGDIDDKTLGRFSAGWQDLLGQRLTGYLEEDRGE